MGYPKEVREQIEILDKYQVDDTLKAFDILHLYPGELAYPDGYQDSRFFNLVGFNTKTMKRRGLGRHDSLDFWNRVYSVKRIKIFADGSTMVEMENPVEVNANTQAAYISEVVK